MIKVRLFIISFTFIFPALQNMTLSAQSQTADSSGICVSDEEVRLFNLINDYRKVLKLPAIHLSNSLCQVAKKHLNDLLVNHPDTQMCNFHSWSDNGPWKPCCYEKKGVSRNCMTGKPSELTSYPGIAYEVVFWDNQGATASTAFEQWKTIPASKDMIISMKKWEGVEWNAMGVAIGENYAILWLGLEPDVIKETRICSSGKM
ncbi:MAG: hypothetical protein JXA03_07190, partial [Bacteroidales bacterium]|nr:hypothetical protein [Bacteroidales bacterium]